jgi:leucyl-tRNA synthetase
LLVQINGKPCVRVTVPKGMPAAEIEALALADAKVVETIAGRAVAKVIVVPGKLVNVVAK